MVEKYFGLAVLIVVVTLGCSSVTEKQCDEAFDHYFTLKMEGVPNIIKKVELVTFEEKRANFLSQCVGKVKPDVINCWLSSKRLNELDQCEKSSPLFQ